MWTTGIVDGRTDLVFDHLARGGSPVDTDTDGTSLIRWCAYYGDVSAIRRLLDAGESLGSLGENFDLSGAAFHGHWQLCQFLLEAGANANHPMTDTRETALHAATCHPGRPEFDLVVEVLLQSGADVHATTTAGRETGSFMRDARTRGETPLHRAAAFGSGIMIRHLLEAGADPEARDAYGDTPLSWASWHCRPDAILRLLLHGSHAIHPERDSRSDHGAGESAMEQFLRGRPRF